MRHIYVKYDEGFGGHVEPEKQARVFSPRGLTGKDTCVTHGCMLELPHTWV